MNFRLLIKEHWNAFVHILYPTNCANCKQELLLDEDFLCRQCLGNIKSLRNPLCRRCSRELPPFLEQRSSCSACRQTSFFFKRSYAVIKYDEIAKNIFYNIKFARRKKVLNVFTHFLEIKLESIKAEILHNDYVIPVPLDKKRKREREFNQSAILAKFISTYLGLSYNTSVLKRIKQRLPQSTLNRQERLVNLTHAFTARNSAKIRNKRILLIDDIFTTGATVNECAKELRAAGAKEITVFTLARA